MLLTVLPEIVPADEFNKPLEDTVIEYVFKSAAHVVPKAKG
jgi:hypothetical protein